MPSNGSRLPASGKLTATAVGRGLPLLTTLTLVTLDNCVRLLRPLVNSCTVPLTRTLSPTLTAVVLFEPWKTNRPSDVAALPSLSLSSSWR